MFFWTASILFLIIYFVGAYLLMEVEGKELLGTILFIFSIFGYLLIMLTYFIWFR